MVVMMRISGTTCLSPRSIFFVPIDASCVDPSLSSVVLPHQERKVFSGFGERGKTTIKKQSITQSRKQRTRDHKTKINCESNITMVIVSHLCLQESFLLPGSTMNATLNLLNISEDVISEKGPYHSNLLTLFEHYGVLNDDDDDDGGNVDEEDDDDDENENDHQEENSHDDQRNGNVEMTTTSKNEVDVDDDQNETNNNNNNSSSGGGGSSSWWSSIFGAFSSPASATTPNDTTNNSNNNDNDDHNDSLSSSSSHSNQTRRGKKRRNSIIIDDPSLNWKVDRVYGQIYGMCIADSTWLNSIVECEKERHYYTAASKTNDESNMNGASEDEEYASNHRNQRIDPNTFNDDHMYRYECRLKNLVPRKKNSQMIFMSHPKEFEQCSNQTILLNDNRKIDFSLVLPTSEIPPTYKGTLLRYIYFLAISIQVSNQKKGVFTKVMTIPFKIRNPVASLASVNSRFDERFDFQWKLFDTTSVGIVRSSIDSNDSSSSSNSSGRNARASSSASLFSKKTAELMNERSKSSALHSQRKAEESTDLSTSSFYYSFRAIDNIISNQSRANFYEITDGDNRVCKFSLSNTAFCIGDTLLGVFDFSQCDVTCLKVNIELIHKESYAKWLHRGYIAASSTNNNQTSSDRNNNEQKPADEGYYHSLESKLCRSSVGYFSRHTLNTLTTDFHMMIPPHAPAQFSTDMIDVKWYLKFTFYLMKQQQENNQEVAFTAQMLQEQRNSLTVDVLEWQLPIQVFVPTHFRPLHTQSMSREMCMLCYHV